MRPALLVLCFLSVSGAAFGALNESYTLFESGHVRPLALSPDGRVLAAVNTPDNRVELLGVGDDGELMHRGSIPVGYEPVAVAWRHDKELWVVNHISDSISVATVDRAVVDGRRVGAVGFVRRTILTGDEPRDIVFAGPRGDLAFVTTARRGQNVTPARLGPLGIDPALSTPGVGRAVVWVYPADGRDRSTTGRPLTRIALFTDTPRALAVGPRGRTVYAAGFMTGNRTASVPAQERVIDHGERPFMVGETVNQPPSHIVRETDGRWLDAWGTDYSASVRFDLPDEDVFAIDAFAYPPRAVHSWAGVGTTLFGMAHDPRADRLFVVNTEARNHAGHEPDVACDVHRPRISIIDGDGVRSVDLNPHLPDDRCETDDAARAETLALPTGIVRAADGRLFVAAMGSDSVGILDGEALALGRAGRRIVVPVSGGGPTGLIWHPTHDRLYVSTRYDNGLSVLDARTGTELEHLRLHSPEPAEVVEGRPFLYDARNTSVSGEVACGSCHVFGHTDHLGWDLGNPEADVLPTISQPFLPALFRNGFLFPDFEASIYLHQQLKGAMTTQSLRGLDNHGPMHWRGDRYDARVLEGLASVQPETGLYDELRALMAFNGTFVALHGLEEEIPEDDMEAFARFTLRLTHPPNAIRRLDDTLTPAQEAGRRRYFDRDAPADAIGPCVACHVLDPDGNARFGVDRPGFFGTDGRTTFDALNQLFKVPHLRNLYDKVGMFGASEFGRFLQGRPIYRDARGRDIEPFVHMGPQVRGFGFLHDGSADSPRRYMSGRPFEERPTDPEERPFVGDVPKVGIPADDPAIGSFPKAELEAFLFAYPGNLAPIVGQQVTVGRADRASAMRRLRLLWDRARAGQCDLVARTVADGRPRGALMIDGVFVDDRGHRHPVDALLAHALRDRPVTFTCAVPGAGVRLALDRDADCALDGDEWLLGGDATDPDRWPMVRLGGAPPGCR